MRRNEQRPSTWGSGVRVGRGVEGFAEGLLVGAGETGAGASVGLFDGGLGVGSAVVGRVVGAGDTTVGAPVGL